LYTCGVAACVTSNPVDVPRVENQPVWFGYAINIYQCIEIPLPSTPNLALISSYMAFMATAPNSIADKALLLLY
jgi:hypothetical protein